MTKKKELLEESTQMEDVELFQEEEEAMTHKGSEEIFEGGPTYDQVEDWKARNNDEVYVSEFDADVFVWRPLRRKEYRDIHRMEGQKDEFYIEEAICRTCVLWPENYAQQAMVFGKAGIPTTLANLITERSGFGRPMTYKM